MPDGMGRGEVLRDSGLIAGSSFWLFLRLLIRPLIAPSSGLLAGSSCCSSFGSSSIGFWGGESERMGHEQGGLRGLRVFWEAPGPPGETHFMDRN